MKCDLHVQNLHSGMCAVPMGRGPCRKSYGEPGASGSEVYAGSHEITEWQPIRIQRRRANRFSLTAFLCEERLFLSVSHAHSSLRGTDFIRLEGVFARRVGSDARTAAFGGPDCTSVPGGGRHRTCGV